MKPPPDGRDARIRRTEADVSRAALHIITTEGAGAITHARVADQAGYAKTTLYSHWPTQTELVTIALRTLGEIPHGPQVGDRRQRLIGELITFRDGIVNRHLDAILMVLAQWGASVAEISNIRDRVSTEGQRIVRALIGEIATGPPLDAAVSMLNGAVICPTLMFNAPPDDEHITAAVDIVLTALEPTKPGSRT